MKMILSLDTYLWNHIIPKIDKNFFRYKFNSVLAVTYISLYHLPRKYLVNYFNGKGKTLFLDTQKLIMNNQVVLNKLIETIQSDVKYGRTEGALAIGQTYISDPNYRYSLGSFQLKYLIVENTVQINIQSNYRFQESPDRITKYLHHWLFSLKNKGKANDFAIEGNNWTVQMNDLTSMGNEQKLIPGLQGKFFV